MNGNLETSLSSTRSKALKRRKFFTAAVLLGLFTSFFASGSERSVAQKYIGLGKWGYDFSESSLDYLHGLPSSLVIRGILLAGEARSTYFNGEVDTNIAAAGSVDDNSLSWFAKIREFFAFLFGRDEKVAGDKKVSGKVSVEKNTSNKLNTSTTTEPKVEVKEIYVEGPRTVVEKITEKVFVGGGISEKYLEDRLLSLNNKLLTEIYTVALTSKGPVTNIYQDRTTLGDIDHLHGATVTGPLYDTNESAGTDGYILQTTGDGVEWVATSTLGISGGGSSQWTTSGSDIYYDDGSVAIGTSTMSARLHLDRNSSVGGTTDSAAEKISFNNNGGSTHAAGINDRSLYIDHDVSGTISSLRRQNVFGIDLDLDNTANVSAGHQYVYGIRVDNAFSGTPSSNPITHRLYGSSLSVSGDLGTAASTQHYGELISVTGTADENYGIMVGSSGATDNYAIYSTAGLNIFTDNVGIGTLDPSSKLTVSHINSTSGNSVPAVSFGVSDNGGATSLSDFEKSNFKVSVTDTGSYIGASPAVFNIDGIFSSFDFHGATDTDGENITFSGIRSVTKATLPTINSNTAIFNGLTAEVSGNLDTFNGLHNGLEVDVSGTGGINTGVKVSSVSGANNNYGIYITSPSSASTNYAIYSSATAQSYFAGNVGIGTTSPSSLLSISKTDSSASLSDTAQYLSFTNSTGNSAAEATDTALKIDYDLSGSFSGIGNRAQYAPALDINITNSASVGSAKEQYVYGMRINNAFSGSSTSVSQHRLYGQDITVTGDLYNFDSAHYGSSINVAGVAQSNYGLLVSSTGATSNYGIAIANPSAASSNYALYSSATAQSYFAGNVGIGDSTPDAKLDIEYTDSTDNANVTALVAAPTINGNMNNGLDKTWSALSATPVLSSAIGSGSSYSLYGLNASPAANAALNGAGDYLSVSGVYANPTWGGSVGGGADTLELIGTRSVLNSNLGSTGVTSKYGFVSEVSGTADMNYGLIVSAAGATTNYGILINSPSTEDNNNYALYSVALSQSYFAGKVGIGDSTPDAKLDVEMTSSAAATDVSGALVTLTDSGSVENSTKNAFLATLIASGDSTTDISSSLNALNGVVQYSGSTLGGGGPLNISGVRGSAAWNGGVVESGDTASVAGLFGSASGDMGTAGFVARHIGVSLSASGTADANYGLYVSSVSGATNNYGLYIGSPTAASTDYAIYSATDAQSYFAGKVGIGDLNPGYDLSVYSTSLAGTYAQIRNAGGDDAGLILNSGGTGRQSMIQYFLNNSEYWRVGTNNDGTVNSNFGIYSSQKTGGAANVLNITVDGYVGIGDVTPDAAIDAVLTTSAANLSSTAAITELIDSGGNSAGAVETILRSTGTLSGTLSGSFVSTDIYGLNLDPTISYTLSNDGSGQYASIYGVASNPSFTGSAADSNDSVYLYGLYTAPASNLGTTADTMKFGLYSYVTGTADTNYGLSVGATGATTNYAAIFNPGSVGIGDNTPDALLDVKGTVCLDINADEACTDNTAALSDARLKTNVTDLEDSLGYVNKLRAVRFSWNGEYNTGNAESLGFIAQEVEEIFPELVIADVNGYKNLDYSKLVAVLAKGEQELDLKIESLALPFEENQDLNFADRFFGRVREWLADATNGITKIFTDEIETKNLCVSDESGEKTCITKAELDELLSGSGPATVIISGGGNSNGSETVEQSVDPVASIDTASTTTESASAPQGDVPAESNTVLDVTTSDESTTTTTETILESGIENSTESSEDNTVDTSQSSTNETIIN